MLDWPRLAPSDRPDMSRGDVSSEAVTASLQDQLQLTSPEAKPADNLGTAAEGCSPTIPAGLPAPMEHEQDSLAGLSKDESVTENQECFTLHESKQVTSKRRRRESSESATTLTLGLVVIFVRTDPGVNSRLNLFAVDTRNHETSATLFGIRTLCGVSLKAYYQIYR